tara:strand:- start:21 stop:539 length:519 start_codon:yes stop_codon:yes gene_type:complete
MAGSLKKIQETTVTSAVSSVTLTGIDSKFDVYLLTLNNVSPATVNADVFLRVTESGTASSDSDYDFSYKQLRTDTTFTNVSNTNQAQFTLSGSLENEAGKTFNGVCYIFNANNSSEYTFITTENGYLADDGTFLGNQGGGVYTQTTTVDGVNISFDTGNIDAGTFKLYGLKK